jgi:hypothetical protein
MKENTNENKWVLGVTFISEGLFTTFMDFYDSLLTATLAKESYDRNPHILFTEILHVSEVFN